MKKMVLIYMYYISDISQVGLSMSEVAAFPKTTGALSLEMATERCFILL
jgi:hypothetical protein